ERPDPRPDSQQLDPAGVHRPAGTEPARPFCGGCARSGPDAGGAQLLAGPAGAPDQHPGAVLLPCRPAGLPGCPEIRCRVRGDADHPRRSGRGPGAFGGRARPGGVRNGADWPGHHRGQHRGAADHPPRFRAGPAGDRDGHLHRGVEHRLVPDLGGHGAAGQPGRLAVCAGIRCRPGRGGRRFLDARRGRTPGFLHFPRRRRRHPVAAGGRCSVDDGGPDRGLRRTGLLLLRRNSLAPDDPGRRAGNGAGGGRGRIVAVPDPRNCRWAGCSPGGTVHQYNDGGGGTGPDVADGPLGTVADAGILVVVVLVGRRSPGWRHHADLHCHHQARAGPGVGGEDVRRGSRRRLCDRRGCSSAAGLPPRAVRFLDGADAVDPGVRADVLPHHHPLRAEGAQKPL
ncbi:Uncharacterized MFS-type transporter, partial [Arthrobacter sp. DR-2P]